MNRELTFAAVAFGLAVVVVALLVGFFGAELNASTVALSVAAAALMYALRAMFGIVTALARPDVAAALYDHAASYGTAEERRDEQRRVLKAIKELDFDHAMGKLSDADHAELLRVYRLRAVELMRASDGVSDLHPDLAAKLGLMPAQASPADEDGANEVSSDEEAASSDTPEGVDVPQPMQGADAAQSTCGACGGANEEDAKFCKHCGKEMAREPA